MQSFYYGVPQRSIPGPLLFNLMINDIEFVLQKIEIILHADDVVIYHPDRKTSIIKKQLNVNINQIGTWCNDNKLISN